MSERNVIQRAFDDWGKASGAEKHSGSWYQRSAEIISVTNLQKSQYGPMYYINQGFWLRMLGDSAYPKDTQCHIRLRLGGLLDDEYAASLDQVLDLDQTDVGCRPHN